MYRPRSTILGFSALALAIGVTGCSLGPERDESGEITETGELDAFSIKVGDCMNNPVPGDTGEEFSSVTAVPCDEVHDMEAFSLFDLPSGSFPGDVEISAQAGDRCTSDFETYVGESYAESIYEVSWFSPTVESWEKGDQEIVCLIEGTVTGDPLEGSVEGLAYVESTEDDESNGMADSDESNGMTAENAGSGGGMTNRESGNDDDPDTDGDELELELDVFALELGDCLNDPFEDNGIGEFSSVSIVPCFQAHDMEAYSFFDLPSGPFPGADAISEAATEGCTIAFQNYVGLSYDDSIYLVSWFTPTLESWSQGDQEVVCLISGTVDGDQLEGSVEGTEV